MRFDETEFVRVVEVPQMHLLQPVTRKAHELRCGFIGVNDASRIVVHDDGIICS